MTEHRKELLMTLSNEQLIYLIDQMNHSLFLITETCVEESKWHIDAETAIQKVRDNIYNLPSIYDEASFKGYIDMKMGKITSQEYHKIVGLN